MKQYTNDCNISHVTNCTSKKSKQPSISNILQSYNNTKKQGLSQQAKNVFQVRNNTSIESDTPNINKQLSITRRPFQRKPFNGYKIVYPSSQNTVKDEKEAWTLAKNPTSSPWVKIGDLYVSLTETGDTSFEPIIDQNVTDEKYKFTIFSGRHGAETGYFDDADSKLETSSSIREKYHYERDIFATLKHMLQIYQSKIINQVYSETNIDLINLYNFIKSKFPKLEDEYQKKLFIRDKKYKDIIFDLCNMDLPSFAALLKKSLGDKSLEEKKDDEKGDFFSLNPKLTISNKLDVKVIDTFSHDDYLKIKTFKDAIKKEITDGRVVILAWCFSINAFALKSDINRYEEKSIADIVGGEFGETSDYKIPNTPLLASLSD